MYSDFQKWLGIWEHCAAIWQLNQGFKYPSNRWGEDGQSHFWYGEYSIEYGFGLVTVLISVCYNISD